MPSFADTLKRLRTDAGLTQAQLAEAAQLGLSTVGQFESGYREPTFATLLRLAKALGVSLAAFDDATAGSSEKPTRRRRKK